jgi:hypothetical protein
MAAGSYVLRRTYVDGDILAASDYVADNQQHIDNQDPQHTDDYSLNVTQMRTFTDTGNVNSESLATTLAGEVERLRYQIKHIKDTINGSTITQWYSKSYTVVVPNGTITSAKLANGATFIQYVRATATNVAINNVTATTLVAIAIAMTRTRVRISANVSQLGSSGTPGGYTITFRLVRNTTVIATHVANVSIGGPPGAIDDEVTRAIFFIDAPGTGPFIYSVSAQTNSSALVSVLGDYQLVLEEIA